MQKYKWTWSQIVMVWSVTIVAIVGILKYGEKMKIQTLSFFAVSSVFFAITACSDDVTKVIENNVGVQSFESQKKFPECNKDNQGEMAIAADTGLVYYCDNSKWKTLNGEKGADGKLGNNGIDGAKGADGISCIANKLTNGIEVKCGGVVIDTLKNGDKGDPGEIGDSGKSCTISELDDKKGYKVLCGGDSLGVILNGTNGDKGETGNPGKNCKIEDKGNGVLEIKCGDEPGEKIYRALCGTKPYDPEQKVCVNQELFLRCGNSYYEPQKQICDKRDYIVYKFVSIGNQTWMAENLKYKTDKSYCYNGFGKPNELENCEKYGRLYTWSAAMNACPSGWHLPTLEEWMELKNYIVKKKGVNVANHLKSKNDWLNENNGEDTYGFSALPAGYVFDYDDELGLGDFQAITEMAYFWSATESDVESAYDIYINGIREDLYDNSSYKVYGYSVRCLENKSLK